MYVISSSIAFLMRSIAAEVGYPNFGSYFTVTSSAFVASCKMILNNRLIVGISLAIASGTGPFEPSENTTCTTRSFTTFTVKGPTKFGKQKQARVNSYLHKKAVQEEEI